MGEAGARVVEGLMTGRRKPSIPAFLLAQHSVLVVDKAEKDISWLTWAFVVTHSRGLAQ